MSDHLGAELAALVDGELDHAARERVLRHLTRCEQCRAEVAAQRRFKDRLRALAEPPQPGADLAERLRRLEGRLQGRADGRAGDAVRRPGGAPRPAGRARRRVTVGGTVLVVGLGVVLALGSPPRSTTRTPVDPTSDAFLVDHARKAGVLPIPEVATAGLSR